MKVLRYVFCIILVTISTHLFAQDTPSSDASNVYSENQLTISVSKQQPVFILKLKSNPSTGYSWFLREYNGQLIDPIGHTFQQGNKTLIGSPGYELWTFKVKPAAFIVPQQTIIRMVYARPWQSTDGSTQLLFRITTRAE